MRRVLSLCIDSLSNRKHWKAITSFFAVAFVNHDSIHPTHIPKECIVKEPMRKDIILLFDILSVRAFLSVSL